MKIGIVLIISLLGLVTIKAQIQNGGHLINEKGPGRYKVLVEENDTIKIPFTMHNGKPLMELTINGEKANLMIDNGVLWNQVWLFGSPLVDKLGLKPINNQSNTSSDNENPFSLYATKDIELAFNDIVFYDQPVLVSPAESVVARMFPGADGQLSNTFFKHFIVEFNFIDNLILLHDPKQFKFDDETVLDMKLTETGTYSVPFEIEMKDGTKHKDRVDIDFGGIYAFKAALNTSISIQVPEGAKERPFYRGTEYFATINSMTIGNYTFEQPEVVFGDENTSRIHPKNIGVIGLPMFMKFETIFDYFNNKLYLKPNQNFSKPFK